MVPPVTRLITAIVLAWTLLLSPALCRGGVLEHPCDCASVGDACEHEESCADDPCEQLAQRSEDSRVLDAVAKPQVAMAIFLGGPCSSLNGAPRSRIGPYIPPPLSRLPFRER